MNRLRLSLILFVTGGLAYGLIELCWRGRTHWTMIAAGGICFVIMFGIYSRFPEMSILDRALAGSAVITGVEFIFGIVFNYLLKMNIWDYSEEKFNVMGIICPMYSVLWGILSVPVFSVCEKIMYFIDHTAEESKKTFDLSIYDEV